MVGLGFNPKWWNVLADCEVRQSVARPTTRPSARVLLPSDWKAICKWIQNDFQWMTDVRRAEHDDTQVQVGVLAT